MHWTAWTFLILGILTTGFGAALLILRLRALQHWTRTHGEVIDSTVSGPDSDRSYSANVTARWNVDGQQYSKKFDNWGSDESRAFFERIVERYPVGSAPRILYNPANPSHAYLDADNKLPFLLVPAVVIFVGLVIVAIGCSIKPASF
jgi:hypothetical protein